MEALLKPMFEIAGFPVSGVTIVIVLGCAGLLGYCLLSGGGGGKSCSARHILMKSESELNEAKARIEAGEDFSKVAAQCSTCPSGRSGGSLGNFTPGSMVPAFDRVCFDPATKLGEVVGPVQTNFGYHLIVVDSRTGVDDEAEASKKK